MLLHDFLKFKQICRNSQLRSQHGYDIRRHRTAKPTFLNFPKLLPYTDHLSNYLHNQYTKINDCMCYHTLKCKRSITTPAFRNVSFSSLMLRPWPWTDRLKHSSWQPPSLRSPDVDNKGWCYWVIFTEWAHTSVIQCFDISASVTVKITKLAIGQLAAALTHVFQKENILRQLAWVTFGTCEFNGQPTDLGYLLNNR